MYRQQHPPLQSRMRGFSMIEMLIALLILSVGMIGIAGLQLKGQQANKEAYIRTQGTMLAYELMDRIRINRPAALAGLYVAPSADARWTAAPKNCDQFSCTGTELVSYDLAQWQLIVADVMPNPTLQIEEITDQVYAKIRYRISIGRELASSERESGEDLGLVKIKTMQWEMSP